MDSSHKGEWADCWQRCEKHPFGSRWAGFKRKRT